MRDNIYYNVGNLISNPFERHMKRPAASCTSVVIMLLAYIMILLVCVVVVLVWSLLAYINRTHLLPSWSILSSYSLKRYSRSQQGLTIPIYLLRQPSLSIITAFSTLKPTTSQVSIKIPKIQIALRTLTWL